MQSGLTLFKSKVARRIFFLFLVSAMFPITIFSCVSFFQVSTQLKEQSMERIQNTAKSYGLILLDRFSFMQMELDIIGASMSMDAQKSVNIFPDYDISNSYLKAVSFISDHRVKAIFGTMEPVSSNVRNINFVPQDAKISIDFEPGGPTGSRVIISKPMIGPEGKPGLIMGEADIVKLWGVGYENILPPLTESCILDHTRNVLFSSFEIPLEVLHRIRFDSESVQSRTLDYTIDGRRVYLAYWPMFLKSKFQGANLIVVLRTKQDDIFAPLSNFKVLFPLVALLAFWVVLLLSVLSIRKSMVPLEKLKNGALRLAERDFNNRIDVKSGDEFESLADILNSSAAHLGRHFHAMEAMAEIDRVIHASLNTQTIVKTAMKHMRGFFSCEKICFGIVNKRKETMLHVFTCADGQCENLREDLLSIRSTDLNGLNGKKDTCVIDLSRFQPSYLPGEMIQDIHYCLILPLFHSNTLAGIIGLGHTDIPDYTHDDLNHVRRLANQLSSALSNACLVEELERLNWGTLEALARTVDAKSKWTAGHSERVATLAVKIAQTLNLDETMVNHINRAAFLHDIGKIGIPLMILDKPEKLTDEEYRQIKEHPVIGAKIIEPIDAYADAIPIILQHHEKYDGTGYPQGLFGDQINIGARILAVADVYDAIISSRPYRNGWVEEKVMGLILMESGKHFDPDVVKAFMTVVHAGRGEIK